MAENSKSSVMKLNEENYGNWSLVRKQLWDIVNGEKMRPLGSENLAPIKNFIRKQAEAHAELVLVSQD